MKNLHWVSPNFSTDQIINAMGDSGFYFLPMLVGYAAALQLKSNPIAVAAITGVLVHSNVVSIASKSPQHVATLLGIPLNANFFGLPISKPTYSIFPIILQRGLLGQLEIGLSAYYH